MRESEWKNDNHGGERICVTAIKKNNERQQTDDNDDDDKEGRSGREKKEENGRKLHLDIVIRHNFPAPKTIMASSPSRDHVRIVCCLMMMLMAAFACDNWLIDMAMQLRSSIWMCMLASFHRRCHLPCAWSTDLNLRYVLMAISIDYIDAVCYVQSSLHSLLLLPLQSLGYRYWDSAHSTRAVPPSMIYYNYNDLSARTSWHRRNTLSRQVAGASYSYDWGDSSSRPLASVVSIQHNEPHPPADTDLERKKEKIETEKTKMWKMCSSLMAINLKISLFSVSFFWCFTSED